MTSAFTKPHLITNMIWFGIITVIDDNLYEICQCNILLLKVGTVWCGIMIKYLYFIKLIAQIPVSSALLTKLSLKSCFSFFFTFFLLLNFLYPKQIFVKHTLDQPSILITNCVRTEQLMDNNFISYQQLSIICKPAQLGWTEQP